MELPSYVQDICDVLLRIRPAKVPEGSLLVGVDGESLHTSLPKECGLMGVAHFLETNFPQWGHRMNCLTS